MRLNQLTVCPCDRRVALPSDRFYRIHRSYIVPMDQVTAISKTSLEIGQRMLTLSENYRADFHQKINSGF